MRRTLFAFGCAKAKPPCAVPVWRGRTAHSVASITWKAQARLGQFARDGYSRYYGYCRYYGYSERTGCADRQTWRASSSPSTRAMISACHGASCSVRLRRSMQPATYNVLMHMQRQHCANAFHGFAHVSASALWHGGAYRLPRAPTRHARAAGPSTAQRASRRAPTRPCGGRSAGTAAARASGGRCGRPQPTCTERSASQLWWKLNVRRRVLFTPVAPQCHRSIPTVDSCGSLCACHGRIRATACGTNPTGLLPTGKVSRLSEGWHSSCLRPLFHVEQPWTDAPRPCRSCQSDSRLQPQHLA